MRSTPERAAQQGIRISSCIGKHESFTKLNAKGVLAFYFLFFFCLFFATTGLCLSREGEVYTGHRGTIYVQRIDIGGVLRPTLTLVYAFESLWYRLSGKGILPKSWAVTVPREQRTILLLQRALDIQIIPDAQCVCM